MVMLCISCFGLKIRFIKEEKKNQKMQREKLYKLSFI